MKKQAAFLNIRKLVYLGILVVLTGCQSVHLPESSDDQYMSASNSSLNGNAQAPFSIGIAPSKASPISLGDELDFQLSSSIPGYGHLYLLNASGNVLVLAENMQLGAVNRANYPGEYSPFTIRANPPLGTERIIFMLTLQPFAGFAQTGGVALINPVKLNMSPEEFISTINQATLAFPTSQWALTETRVRIVQ